MAFLNRINGVLRQTVSKLVNLELSVSNSSLYQAIRSMSSSKLFVGGLSYGTDEMSLREAFSQHGEVIEARIIMDRETGRSRGFGFVTYTSSEEASSAMQDLDGQDLHGRRIRVNYATEKPRLGGYRSGFGNEGGGYGGAVRYGNNNYGGGGAYGNNNYGGAGGYGNVNYGAAGGYGNRDYGGAGGYRNDSNYGGAGGYGSNFGEGPGYSSNTHSDSGVSNYAAGASSFDGADGGGVGAPAVAGDNFSSGSSNNGGFAAAGNSGALSTSYDEDLGRLDPGQTGIDAVDEGGDDVVEGEDRDDNDASDDNANTRR